MSQDEHNPDNVALYSPLPSGEFSFRLLRLLPSLDSDSDIECELITASINDFEN